MTFHDVTGERQHRAELEGMLKLLSNSRDEIQRKNVSLEILATRDSLTECFNRRAFFERFDPMFDQKSTLSCVMIDVDHFKNVNDTYGHHTGDIVLKSVAGVLRDLHESAGLVCRYGGEEFCVVLPDADLNAAVEAAEATRIAISEIRLDDPADLRLTASLGVSELQFEPENPQALINQADACLYVAKREGRNRVVTFRPQYLEHDETETDDQSNRLDIELSHQAVAALTRGLDARDAAVAQHCRRVANLCTRWTDDYLTADESYLTGIAAMMHHIDRLGSNPPPAAGTVEPKVMIESSNAQTSLCESILAAIGSSRLLDIVRGFHALRDGRDADDATSEFLYLADTYDRHCQNGDPASAWSLAAVEVGDRISPPVLAHVASLKARENRTDPNDATTCGIMRVQEFVALEIGRDLQTLTDAVHHGGRDGIREAVENLKQHAHLANLESVVDCAENVLRRIDDPGLSKRSEMGPSQTPSSSAAPDDSPEDWQTVLSEISRLRQTATETQQWMMETTMKSLQSRD